MSNPLGSVSLVRKSGEQVGKEALESKVVAIYFSAHWCPPCRGFTPALRKFYETLKAKGESIEIVFVSADKNEDEFKSYFQNDHGDWLGVSPSSSDGQKIGQHYDIKGFPTLIVVNNKGEVIEADGRGAVQGAISSEATIADTFAKWKKDAGDWRETAGSALGGENVASNAEAMRAARLARLGGSGSNVSK
mmetsp:Transcript_41186/g.64424  ORF Transcript_41186/g.64424 Transcript_41186/m.64424 type:complete len:191 (+) Transcript_41186:56-628(+)